MAHKSTESAGRVMITKTVSLDHPVVFAMDPSNQYQVPDVEGDSVVFASPSCVAVRAVAYVDGDVTVELGLAGEGGPRDDLQYVFDGRIATPSKSVAIMSADESLLETQVVGESTRLLISVNDLKYPDRIRVEVVALSSVT